MQHEGKTVEIGYSCFGMNNQKGGRGFRGVFLHNPMGWSGCLVHISRKTNEKQLGARSPCCGGKCKANREMIVREDEWSEAE